MNGKKLLWVVFLIIGASLLSHVPAAFVQEKIISYEQADKFINQLVTVEGTIIRTYNSGRTCFLNFHQDYQRYLSLVIFASDFSKFPANPEKFYLNKKVRVRGRVKLYQGRPEIILSSPSQIVVLEDKPEPERDSRSEVTEENKEARKDVSGNKNKELSSEKSTGQTKSSPSIPEISWEEAGNYYGQKVWVRGRVVAANNTGRVCFLNFHRNWRRYFTVVIFASAFDLFPAPPEKYYLGKEIRVIGEIREYQGKPEIIVESPDQIEILD
ncbi:MAG: hypothetical protein H5U07_05820 [Candidatus Aminicenantes bacterium]|nr:hypothetical protein [Candidatus Aminicenantes bacterium]